MEAINYTIFRKNLAATIDQVNENHNPILITRQSGKPAVIMSLEDYNSFEETAYLMKSPKNAERLNTAIAELESGAGVEKDLVQE